MSSSSLLANTGDTGASVYGTRLPRLPLVLDWEIISLKDRMVIRGVEMMKEEMKLARRETKPARKRKADP